jgi:uncharacterized protein YdbL (DUF1318 family)
MRMRRRWLLPLFALLFAGAAHALDLDSAKAQGLVGERTDGYVAAVASAPSAEVKAVVDDVNAKRKASYEEIAAKNGTAPDQVAGLAAQKLLQKAPPGTWIFSDGRWYQKK